MPLANTSRSYGGVTKTFHWLTALLIFTVIPLGLIANGLAEDIRNPAIPTTEADFLRAIRLFSLHKTLGVAIFAVALARILWALTQPRPGLLNADRKLESMLAETVHWLLYGALLLVPLTGWISHSATTGFAPILWPLGQALPFVPQSESVAATFSGLHIVFGRVLIVAILLHAAGALKHHLVDRDFTLRRMLPGRMPAPRPPAQNSHAWPLVAALAIWAGAVGVGAGLGLYSPADAPVRSAQGAPDTPTAPTGTSWRVTQGTLGLTITQMGSEVSGQFADWNADISFEPRDTVGPAGTVSVIVAIASLTLGAVGDQAMGPDFFDADRFPVARFDATIQRRETGYDAIGALTIRERTLPLTLPFDLTLDDDTATMTASTRIERLDYDIGATLPDESSLGFSVDVRIDLTATQAGD